MLDALRDIEIASEFLGSKVEEGTEEEDPLDTHYKKLHCDIRPIPHDSGDFKLVEKYLKQTHAPTHTVWLRIFLLSKQNCNYGLQIPAVVYPWIAQTFEHVCFFFDVEKHHELSC